MIGGRISLLVMIISVPAHVAMQFSDPDEIRSECPNDARVNLTGGTLDPSSGFLVKSGYVFPPESRWTQDGEIFGCGCYNRSKCLPLYCPEESFMYHQVDQRCERFFNSTEDYESILATVPSIYSLDFPIESVTVNDETVYTDNSYGMCRWMRKVLVMGEFMGNGFYVTSDGGIYLPEENITKTHNFDGYCLCSDADFYIERPMCVRYGVIHTIIERYDNATGNYTTQGASMAAHVGMIISVPFLLITFIVYTILPEMKNIHGMTLRGYVGCLLVAYTTLAVIQITGPISDLYCRFFAFTIHFSFIASFFWLNAMCFDIWWTFGGFRSIRASVDQRDKKRFRMYFIYAFGCASILSGICMIMDLVEGIPENLIRPEFRVESDCWFKTDGAKALYFYGPMGITILCNIFFFISTAVKIIRHKRNTAHHLKGVNSQRHDDKKQWFNLYLKLFVVMGINWSMEIISWLYKDLKYIWHITDLANALQGLIIFIIFICKKTILRQLVKRFGCQMPNFLSQDSTKSGASSSTAQTGVSSIPRS